jgi:hypothetical protein
MEYKVIPFVAAIDPKKGTSQHVAEQLESLIKNFSNQGWNYVQLESVTTFVNPETGCFGLSTRKSTMANRLWFD